MRFNILSRSKLRLTIEVHLKHRGLASEEVHTSPSTEISRNIYLLSTRWTIPWPYHELFSRLPTVFRRHWPAPSLESSVSANGFFGCSTTAVRVGTDASTRHTTLSLKFHHTSIGSFVPTAHLGVARLHQQATSHPPVLSYSYCWLIYIKRALQTTKHPRTMHRQF